MKNIKSFIYRLFSYKIILITVFLILGIFVKFKGTSISKDMKYPWMGSLTVHKKDNYNSRFCGAALIDELHVITAGHCVVGRSQTKSLYFSVGSHNLTDVKTFIRVIDVNLHPGYNHLYVPLHDIAILTLEKPYKLKSYLKLPTENIYDSNTYKTYILGWGTLDRNRERLVIPNTLKYIPVELWSMTKCYSTLPMFSAPEMICGGTLTTHDGGNDGESPCYGDSGGPIVVEHNKEFYIKGIVSWGKGCYSDSYPSAFTNVYNYNIWINLILKKGQKNA